MCNGTDRDQRYYVKGLKLEQMKHVKNSEGQKLQETNGGAHGASVVLKSWLSFA